MPSVLSFYSSDCDLHDRVIAARAVALKESLSFIQHEEGMKHALWKRPGSNPGPWVPCGGLCRYDHCATRLVVLVHYNKLVRRAHEF
jgi:hypothetical protein